MNLGYFLPPYFPPNFPLKSPLTTIQPCPVVTSPLSHHGLSPPGVLQQSGQQVAGHQLLLRPRHQGAGAGACGAQTVNQSGDLSLVQILEIQCFDWWNLTLP